MVFLGSELEFTSQKDFLFIYHILYQYSDQNIDSDNLQ